MRLYLLILNTMTNLVRKQKKWLLWSVAVAIVLYGCKGEGDELPVPDQAYASTLLEYVPAPGQFINAQIGDLASAKGILNTNNGLVSLGAWGGSITLGFDHTVANVANAADLRVYNNAFNSFAEPGVVWVMKDENGNGLPDDTWYEIAGSETDQEGYIRNYEITYFKPSPITENVTWKDNQGHEGVIKTNNQHKQSYYPEWMGESYTLSGVLLPSTHIQSEGIVTSQPFDFGYVDNQAGEDDIDIDWAIDQTGKQVHLSGIDFIRIQTGIQADMGLLGEGSTEIRGVADIRKLP